MGNSVVAHHAKEGVMLPPYGAIELMIRVIDQVVAERQQKSAHRNHSASAGNDRSIVVNLKGFVRRGRS
jgi:hypothetical protein